MTPESAALLASAGLVAGAVNAVAGGGSLISFPALLAAGYPPVTANVTNTVALLPGFAGSVAGSRSELGGQRSRVLLLAATGGAGAVAGAVLLLTTPSAVFDAVVPYLILLACGLLLAQPRLAALVQQRAGDRAADRSPLLLVSVLLAGVYGAYFGAGLGVMLLGLLGIFLAERLSRVNAIKNVLSTVVNGLAVLAFGIFGPVAWEAVAVMAVASLGGGYVGGRLARRIPSTVLRAAVVVYGVLVAGVLIAQQG